MNSQAEERKQNATSTTNIFGLSASLSIIIPVTNIVTNQKQIALLPEPTTTSKPTDSDPVLRLPRQNIVP